MALFLIIAVGLVAWAGLWKLAGLSRGPLFLVGASMSLGLVGYALQGQPALPSAYPKEKPAQAAVPASDGASDNLMGRFGGEAEALKQAESYFRIGRPDLAARVIKLAISGNPNSPALWTGLGNALVAQGKGFLTPAAEFAYKKALSLTPGYPGALYFYAVSLVENQRVEEARPLFKLLLDGIPDDAPFRAQLKSDLERAGLVDGGTALVK